MKNISKNGVLNALGTLAYIIIVSQLMRNGDRIFGKVDNAFSPILFLLLFTLSAIVVGGLVLGQPIMLYLDGKKKEAIAFFLTTAGWLAGFTILAIILAIIIK